MPNINKRRANSGGRNHIRGWTRTGLELETVVYLNYVPLDTIIDVGSSLSMIDFELCELSVFHLDLSSMTFSSTLGVEAAKITHSMNIIL